MQKTSRVSFNVYAWRKAMCFQPENRSFDDGQPFGAEVNTAWPSSSSLASSPQGPYAAGMVNRLAYCQVIIPISGSSCNRGNSLLTHSSLPVVRSGRCLSLNDCGVPLSRHRAPGFRCVTAQPYRSATLSCCRGRR